MMDSLGFHDQNITDLIEKRTIAHRPDIGHNLQMHSSLIRRLCQERVLEGHLGCVNAVAWNSTGSLLISGSDDTQVNIYSYSTRKLLQSIDTGHSSNIFCTKFVPETSDELVASGAGDAEVRVFNRSHLRSNGPDGNEISPSAMFQCHTRRVKKLAVEIGNPNVVWSACEDGTLRQHDFREVSSCPPAGSPRQECRSILLDLRCGAKRSLADPPKQLLALKSCDISTTRPHLLLVGGSDAFARVYDRRMLPPLSSCRKKLSAPPCVGYFCPIHLADRAGSRLHLTHVTFSPDGKEVLVSYSGEHVYLMDVNHSGGSSMQYTSKAATRVATFTPTVNTIDLQSSIFPVCNGYRKKRNLSSRLDKCRKLVQIAEKSLLDNTNYFRGIEACNEVLNGHGREIGATIMHECLCARAALLLKRKWKNDAYMALRDCQGARAIDSSSIKALHIQSQALLQLDRNKEALQCATAAQTLAPLDSDVAETVESIKEHIAAAEAEKIRRSKVRESKLQPIVRPMNVLEDAPWSETEDSDNEEGLELEFEAPVSGDEEHDSEPNALHGSLNVRILRRGDQDVETGHTNGSYESHTSSSSKNDKLVHQPETGIDMKQRYVGHCNMGTDIKQASFLGQRGEYIASGSDDGRWYIWEKRTGRLIKVLDGDESVVNCVQCHPSDCVVATSGIDSTIKIWSPTDSVPSIVAAGAVGPESDNVLVGMEENQRSLSRVREEVILPFELLESFRMHEFSEGTLHPFECAQS